MFSNLLQTARSILNSLICVVHFSSNFNSVFHKKVHENYWCCSSIACQEKGTDWILRILLIKINYISPYFWQFIFVRVKVIKE